MDIIILCFNTSHVTLYRLFYDVFVRQILFQYISCYSLSSGNERIHQKMAVSIHLMLLFIRAKPLVRKRRCSVSIHLMLLFIVVQALLERTRWRFNTSHVTLYRCFVCGSCLRSPVSIHLMLLFIKVIT